MLSLVKSEIYSLTNRESGHLKTSHNDIHMYVDKTHVDNDYDYDYEITLFEHKQNQHIHIIIVQ